MSLHNGAWYTGSVHLANAQQMTDRPVSTTAAVAQLVAFSAHQCMVEETLDCRDIYLDGVARSPIVGWPQI